jgi:hypothetical protein
VAPLVDVAVMAPPDSPGSAPASRSRIRLVSGTTSYDLLVIGERDSEEGGARVSWGPELRPLKGRQRAVSSLMDSIGTALGAAC